MTKATLGQFFVELRRTRGTAAPPKLERLRHLFSRIAEVRRAPTPKVIHRDVKRVLNGSSWMAFTSEFRPCYEREFRSGAFLNVWDVAGLGSNETRNAAVVAWLLNCRASHGLGAEILQSFLDELDPELGVPFLARSAWRGPYAVETENYPGDLESRVDIVLQSTESLIFLELKIDHTEGVDQIKRYLQLARAKARARSVKTAGVVYLTKAGAPMPSVGISGEVIRTTWHQLARAIRKKVRTELAWTDRILLQFASHVARF